MKDAFYIVLGFFLGLAVCGYFILKQQVTNEIELVRLQSSVNTALTLGCKDTLIKAQVVKDESKK